MLRHAQRHAGPATLVVALALACAESPPTGPASGRESAVRVHASENAAVTWSETFSVPSPPIRMTVPCLGTDNQLQMSGTWNGWARYAQTANGHLHISEHVDWSDVRIVSTGGRTWLPGPGAHESFTFNLPVAAEDEGESAYTVMHAMHGRFLSQDGAQDLQVSHAWHQLLGPDLVLRRNEFVPFGAHCLGQPE